MRARGSARCRVFVSNCDYRVLSISEIFFFFQAEDGIRDDLVTGVQTCALPISENRATTNHSGLRAWVDEVAALTGPDEIHWCDGSAEEYDQLAQTLLDSGAFQRLDRKSVV